MAFPTLLRFRDLKPKKVIENRPTLQRRIQYDGFAPGCLLGKNTRVWTEDEIGAWLETRSASRTAPSKANGNSGRAG